MHNTMNFRKHKPKKLYKKEKHSQIKKKKKTYQIDNTLWNWSVLQFIFQMTLHFDI